MTGRRTCRRVLGDSKGVSMSRGPRAVLEMLAAVPLFSRCDQHELMSLASMGVEMRVLPGRVLDRPGQRPVRSSFILSGLARREVDGRTVATLGPGDFFGEVPFVHDGTGGATVVAETAMELLVVDTGEFAGLLADAPAMRRKITGALTEPPPKMPGAGETFHAAQAP